MKGLKKEKKIRETHPKKTLNTVPKSHELKQIKERVTEEK
jgi:hypothetical protein